MAILFKIFTHFGWFYKVAFEVLNASEESLPFSSFKRENRFLSFHSVGLGKGSVQCGERVTMFFDLLQAEQIALGNPASRKGPCLGHLAKPSGSSCVSCRGPFLQPEGEFC